MDGTTVWIGAAAGISTIALLIPAIMPDAVIGGFPAWFLLQGAVIACISAAFSLAGRNKR